MSRRGEESSHRCDNTADRVRAHRFPSPSRGLTHAASTTAAVILTNEPDADGERGVIVNTSSVAGEDGITGMAGYAATKVALIGLMLPAA